MQPQVATAASAAASSTCFHCKKEGHWARDCPLKTPPTPKLYTSVSTSSTPPSPPPAIPNVCDFPQIECDNGHGPCTAKVSQSVNNPGRIYYACPSRGSNCRFFKWHDQLKMKNGTEGGGGIGARLLSPSRSELEPTPKLYASTSSTCFHCKKEGHWARDCPLKTPPTPELYTSLSTSGTPSPPPLIPNVCDLPLIECDNGHGACTAKVSQCVNNPGRIYYACPSRGSKCRFFKWHDQLKMKNGTRGGIGAHPLSPSRSEYPTCSCGAGDCRLMLKTSQPDAGRLYFVCPIAKGHGACPFFQWYDGKASTGLTSHVDESRDEGSLKSSFKSQNVIKTLNYDFDDYGDLSLDHSDMKTCESAKIDGPQSLPNFDLVPFDPTKIEDKILAGREEHDDTSNVETTTKFSNLQVVLRERLNDPVVQEGGLLDPLMGKVTQFPRKTSLQADILQQKIESWRQSCATGDRLTGGVFPSLDPIFIPKKTQEYHSEGIIDRPHSPLRSVFHSLQQMPSEDDAQPPSGVLPELSGIKNLLSPLQDNVITGTITEALEQAALPIQNLLLTLLESMDPLQYESMTSAAGFTFAALDHLSVDYKHFSERVRKFICCASSLAEVERSIHSDISSQELIKWYHNEKERFDNISLAHADIMDAFTTSDHHLQSLRKEAARLKEMLLQVENQMSLCEAETSERKTRANEASKDMIESQKKLQAAAQKAEAAKELYHQREITRNAAKAAFEEARVNLRS